MKKHATINEFNPDVKALMPEHQDFFENFNAGEAFKNFNEFIRDEAFQYAEEGNGATYLVFNTVTDSKTGFKKKELMAYFTLAATAIPYTDRIRLDPDEAAERGQEFDEKHCGIPALEIKMFAVDCAYQDLFYEYEGEELPIAAWILRRIITLAYDMMKGTIGFKAVFLHAVPTAVAFYKKNGFHDAEQYMEPLYGVDDEFQAMYLSFCEVHVNQDE